MPLKSMNHFKAFRITATTIKAVGQGMNTLSLVNKAISIREAEKAKKLSTMPMQYWQKFPTGILPKKNRPQQSKNWLLSLTNTSNHHILHFYTPTACISLYAYLFFLNPG